jgi:hypothetical protein
MGQGREDLYARERRLDKAAVARATEQHVSFDAQPVSAAHRGERHDAAGAARGGRRRRRTDDLFGINVADGQVLWRRRFENRLANQAPSTTCSAQADRRPRPRWCRYLPANTVFAVSWDGRLCRSTSATARIRAAGEVHSRQRQAVCAQLQGWRHLHSDGAGVRWPDQRLPLVRSRVTPRQHVHSGGRRLWGRRGAAIDAEGRVYLGTGDAMFDPGNRRPGNGIVG